MRQEGKVNGHTMVYSHMEYLEVYAHSFILLLSYLIIEFIYNTNGVYLKFIIYYYELFT